MIDSAFLLDAAVLFVAAFFAAFIGVITGGNTLITYPTLVAIGLPVHVAVATNRFGTLGIPAAALTEFGRRGLVNLRVASVLALLALVGGFLGANIVLAVDPAWVKRITGVLVLVILTLILAKPQLGIEKRDLPRTPARWLALGTLTFGIGVYGGFFGAGMSTFMTYALVVVFGQTLLESVGTRALAIAGIIISSVVVFIYHGVVEFRFGVVMLAASTIGAWFGARYAMRLGNRAIKIIFAVVVAGLGLRMVVF